MILMQDGRLFYSGSHVFGQRHARHGLGDLRLRREHRHGDPRAPGQGRARPVRERAAAPGPGPEGADDRRRQHRLQPGGQRLTDIIDLKAANPAYTVGPQIPQGTVDLGNGKVAETGQPGQDVRSAVLLPDGKVLETGGGLHNRANPVFEASMFDPATSTFDPVAADPEARGYHSSAFLLPDGRVMATGDNPGNGTWNHNVSIYTPPYLLKGTVDHHRRSTTSGCTGTRSASRSTGPS